jgi:hypothetical protein
MSRSAPRESTLLARCPNQGEGHMATTIPRPRRSTLVTRLLTAACAAAVLAAVFATSASASLPATDPFGRAAWIASHPTTLQDRIDISYRGALGRHATAYELSYWTTYMNSSSAKSHYAQVGIVQQYKDLVQWHKDYLGTPAGATERVGTISRAYAIQFGRQPHQYELSYWIGQIVYTCDELRQWLIDWQAAGGTP